MVSRVNGMTQIGGRYSGMASWGARLLVLCVRSCGLAFTKIVPVSLASEIMELAPVVQGTKLLLTCKLL